MRTLVLRYGLMMAASFTAFFLLMHLFGLSHHYNLRIFNAFIHLGFMYAAIRQWYATRDASANYINGVAVGMATSAVGVLLFSLFMLFFLWFSPDFLARLQATLPIGRYLTPFTASLIIFMEGIGMSVVGAYLVTRYVLAGMHRA